MEPDISPEQARKELQDIRSFLRETGQGLDVANGYVQERLGFPDYQTFVYYAQNGVMPDQDPDQRRAEVAEMGTMRRFGEAMLGGIPFSDEIAGFNPFRAARGGPVYDEGMVDRMRGRREVMRDDYPWATMAAEMVPGLLIPVGAASAIGSRMAARGAGPLLTSVASAAGGGALEGGLFGLGEGEGVRDRLTQGAIGTAAGGVVGGLFGLGLGAAGSVGNRIMRVGGDAMDEWQGRRSAGRWMRRFLDEQNLDEPTITQRLNEFGEDAVVADAAPSAGGQQIFAARSLSGGQLDRPGGPAQRLAGRHLERGDRIDRDLMFITDEMGIPVAGRAEEAAQALKDKAQREFYGPLDDEFGEFSLGQLPGMVNMFRQDPEMAQYALRIFGDVERPLRFSDFQALRNAMRARLERMDKDLQAPIGAKEQLQRQIAMLTEQMNQSFGDRVAKADQLWARAAGITDAYNAGLKLGTTNSPLRIRRALANEFDNLEGEQRMALLAGAIDRLGQKIIDSPTGGSAGSKIVNDARGMREWLTEVLGEDGYNQLTTTIQREQAFQTTHREAGLNSLTAQRTENIEQMKDAVSRPGMRRIEWFWKVADWLADVKALNREKGRAIGEALMAGDTEPMMALLRETERGVVGPGGSGANVGALAAGLQSPLNRFLLGTYLTGTY